MLPSSQNQIFGENQNASSAAVLLSGTSALDQGSVRGIAQLVASSVPGLQLNKVTITDASGELLWPQAAGGAGGSGGEVQEAEQRYDQSMAASLDAMLAQTLGPGKAQVLVYANMNVNQTTKESLEYGKAGTPTAAEQGRSKRSPAPAPAPAAVTGTANLTAAASGHQRKVQLQARNDKLLAGRQQDRHPLDDRARHGGKPARLGAARQLRARRRAAGDPRSRHQRRRHPDQARGHDLDRTGRVREAHNRERPASSPLSDAKYVLLGLGAILFLFFTTRSLRKREKETIDEPVWLRELEAPMRLSELERETSTRPSPAMAGVVPSSGGGSANGFGQRRRGGRPPAGRAARRQIDPDRVAQQLRTWMQED